MTTMNTSRKLAGLAAALLCTLLLACSAQAAEKIRLLVVSGGHDFQTNQFHQVFQDNPDVTFKTFTHPKAQAQLRPDAATGYDVLVLYDLWQSISEEGKADFLAFLKAGKGLLVLHHAVANYQKWPEYENIIGGRYYLEKTMVKGVEKARSIYKHDVDFKVHIADLDHPVTRGLKDFQIHDETYGLFDMGSESHLLLTTEESTSAKNIGWAKTYGPARVVFIQLGHDGQAYGNPSYRQLVSQAIQWVSKRD
jgi:uncharacterized protein